MTAAPVGDRPIQFSDRRGNASDLHAIVHTQEVVAERLRVPPLLRRDEEVVGEVVKLLRQAPCDLRSLALALDDALHLLLHLRTESARDSESEALVGEPFQVR